MPGPSPASTPARSWPGGTSFAGRAVISIAGQGEALAAIIAQVSHVSGPAAVRATGLRASLRVAGPGIRDLIGARTGRQPVYVDSAARPGETGVMTTPDAVPGMNALITESGLKEGDYPVTVAARDRPQDRPLLSEAICHRCPFARPSSRSWTPTLSPRATSQRRPPHAWRTPTVRVYSGGHFDPYVEPLFTTVIADQLAFLRQHVPLPERPNPDDCVCLRLIMPPMRQSSSDFPQLVLHAPKTVGGL